MVDTARAVRAAAQASVMRKPRTLSVMPTFTCPAACAECGTLSSPHDRTRLEVDRIIDAIDQAKELGFYNVVFTGGEATLRWAELLHCIAHARGLGFPVRLVTNAHWATDLDVARKRLGELIAAGLSEINYSTGDEHSRFVPLDRVAFAIVAACERRHRVHVMVEHKKQNSVTRERLLEHPLVRGLTPAQQRWLTVTSSPWMPLRHDVVHRYDDGLATTRRNRVGRGGCESVLHTYTVQADGRVGSCCGLGLRVIPELNVTTVDEPDFLSRAIVESEEDFLKLWIHYYGPESIVAWAAQRDPSIDWEGLYAHRCQFCQRLYGDEKIRAVVREHWEEMIGQILQAAWLEEVHVPEMLSAAGVPTVHAESRADRH